jgi:hypothetical protein
MVGEQSLPPSILVSSLMTSSSSSSVFLMSQAGNGTIVDDLPCARCRCPLPLTFPASRQRPTQPTLTTQYQTTVTSFGMSVA